MENHNTETSVLLFGCADYRVLKVSRELGSACTSNNIGIIELLVKYIISFSCSHAHTLTNVKIYLLQVVRIIFCTVAPPSPVMLSKLNNN